MVQQMEEIKAITFLYLIYLVVVTPVQIASQRQRSACTF